jgi:hypothetical protein
MQSIETHMQRVNRLQGSVIVKMILLSREGGPQQKRQAVGSEVGGWPVV